MKGQYIIIHINKFLIYLIIGLISLIIISFIAFFLKYRNIIKKNKYLEEQVNSISFSEKGEDDEENKDEKYIFI